MSKPSYTVIPDSFLDYGLKLSETVALSVIHGFCQDGESGFRGSYSYLARKCMVSRLTAIRIVKRLTNKGFLRIEQNEVNGVKFNTIWTDLGGSIKMIPVVSEEHQGSIKMTPEGSIKMIPKNKDIENKEKERETHARKRFTPPTMSDVMEYYRTNGFQSSPGAFYDHFTQNGWKSRGTVISDWKAAARNWERRMRSGEFKQ